jgi:hypothetical protein
VKSLFNGFISLRVIQLKTKLTSKKDDKMREYILPKVARREFDEEEVLRSLGIDEADIEMILHSRQERIKWN